MLSWRESCLIRWLKTIYGCLIAQRNHSKPLSLLSISLKVGKAAVDTADDDGWTPLIIAASAGHNQLVEMLLDNGANVNATTSQVVVGTDFGFELNCAGSNCPLV